jgi:hypothetical protein
MRQNHPLQNVRVSHESHRPNPSLPGAGAEAFDVEYPSGASVHRATRITINLSRKVNSNATFSHCEAQALPGEPRQAGPDGGTSPRSSASFKQCIRR